MFPPRTLRATAAIVANRQGQPTLWRHGISGDLPILLACVNDGDALPLARQALQAHAFWRGRGFVVDLVLLADRPASYREELYDALATLARASDSRDVIDRPGGVFVRRAGQLGDDRGLLFATARVVLYGDRGSLADQTDALSRTRELPPPFVPTRPLLSASPTQPPIAEVRFANRHRRLHARWSRVRHHRRAARALVERAGEPERRLPRHRRGTRLHLGGQQPGESTDAVEQRPGQRSAGRGRLPSRR